MTDEHAEALAQHADALAQAAGAAARLGVALALFEDALKALAAATPQCECGWADGHRGRCRPRPAPDTSWLRFEKP